MFLYKSFFIRLLSSLSTILKLNVDDCKKWIQYSNHNKTEIYLMLIKKNILDDFFNLFEGKKNTLAALAVTAKKSRIEGKREVTVIF